MIFLLIPFLVLGHDIDLSSLPIDRENKPKSILRTLGERAVINTGRTFSRETFSTVIEVFPWIYSISMVVGLAYMADEYEISKSIVGGTLKRETSIEDYLSEDQIGILSHATSMFFCSQIMGLLTAIPFSLTSGAVVGSVSAVYELYRNIFTIVEYLKEDRTEEIDYRRIFLNKDMAYKRLKRILCDKGHCFEKKYTLKDKKECSICSEELEQSYDFFNCTCENGGYCKECALHLINVILKEPQPQKCPGSCLLGAWNSIKFL